MVRTYAMQNQVSYTLPARLLQGRPNLFMIPYTPTFSHFQKKTLAQNCPIPDPSPKPKAPISPVQIILQQVSHPCTFLYGDPDHPLVSPAHPSKERISPPIGRNTCARTLNSCIKTRQPKPSVTLKVQVPEYGL